MIIGRFVCSLMALALLTGLPRLASAQASSASPTGTPPPVAGAASAPLPGKSSVKVDMVPSLIVMNAAGASLDGQTLTLAGVSPNSIIFADRPTRAAGHLLTHHLLEEWTVGSFARRISPNATVSAMSKEWRLGSRCRRRAAGPAS